MKNTILQKIIFCKWLIINTLFSYMANAEEKPCACDPASDKAALMALYNATNGNNWVNVNGWETNDPDLSKWYGVTLNDDGCVTHLNLSSNDLIGSIPIQLGDLTSLTSLNLSNNQLSGSIPSSFTNLSNLSAFYFNGTGVCIPQDEAFTTWLNGITTVSTNNNPCCSEKDALMALYNATYGQFWDEDTNWGSNEPLSTWYGVTVNGCSVTSLDLPANNLSGSIPPEIGNLTSLTNLNLSYNDLDGSIPTQLGDLTSLTNLNLSENQLSGSIPTQLENLTSLTHLNLSSNNLSGSIPTEIGNLTSLRVLTFFENQLSGSIPSSFTNLTLTGFGVDFNNVCIPQNETFLSWLNGIEGAEYDNNPCLSLVQTVIGSNSITLTWSGSLVEGADGFEIQRATDSGFINNVETFTFEANQTSYEDTGLPKGTYYYRIRAILPE